MGFVFSWKRELRPRDLAKRNSLHQMTDGSLLSLDGEDILIWKPQKSGVFSVKSMCLEIHKLNLQPSHDVPKVYGMALSPLESKCYPGLPY